MRVLFFIVVPLLLANASWSEATLTLERLTLVLTGELPSATMRKQYQEGTKTLLELARELRDTEAFEQRLAQFFQEKLLITAPVDLVNLYVHPVRANGDSVNAMSKVHFKWREVGSKRYVFDWQEIAEVTDLVAYYGNLLRNPAEHHPLGENSVSRHLYFRDGHYLMKLFDTNAFNQDSTGGYDVLKQKIEDGVAGTTNQSAWRELQKVWQEAEFCERENVAKIEVQPYWDMDKTVKACPATIAARFCGKNFHKCFPYALAFGDLDNDNLYRRRVAAAMTLEPGRMMAKLVQEDKKYSEILTSSKGVVDGHYLHFLHNFGNIITKSYHIRSSGGLRLEANVLNSYPNLRSLFDTHCGQDHSCLSKTDWHWIERGGNKHAGVLTMLAFHRATNGWRAKANKARSALLCREFVDPPGAKADPNDTRVPELRAYCKGCHVYLEPMARFFYRWPDTGNDSIYFYNHLSAKPLRQQSYKDTGCSDCAPVEGDDVAGFADILAGSGKAFKQCAVRRAFEFIMRRSPNSKESKELLPQYLQIYNDSYEKLWKVMEKIIASEVFTESADAL